MKYKLVEILPKNITIDFKNINENFLEDLKKCLSNPIRFLYIGSDHYDEKGNLFFTKDTKIIKDKNDSFKSFIILSSKLERIIKEAYNKCEVVILAFLNSQNIYEYFLSNNFPYVIYFNKSKDLNEFFKHYPYYYFYFQRCFQLFTTNFILYLCKFCYSIEDSFMKAIDDFAEMFSKLSDYTENKEEKDRINELISKLILNQILVLGGKEKGIDFYFNQNENLNNLSFSKSSSNLNLLNNESKNSIESKFINNFDMKKNIYMNEDENERKKKKSKEKAKILEFIRFPKGGLSNELFEKLYNNRMYGMKKILSKIINKIIEDKLIILYGDYCSGKTRICLELCKYFYMNSFFKEGIFYINFNTINKLKNIKELKGLKKIKNEESMIKDALLIFDDLDEKSKDFYKYINNLNTYIIIVINKKEQFLKDWNNYISRINKENNIYQNIIKKESFINLNIPLNKKDAEDFIKYNNIINNIKESENDYNFNDKIYIKDLYQKIKNKTDNKK